MDSDHLVIVGSGIIGLAHALTALDAGWRVTLFERHGRPLGASVRNFGTLWPVGCAIGVERDQALYGVRRWKQIAGELGIWTKPQGSLSLAYREEAWAVLNEFVAAPGAHASDFELLDSSDVSRRFPAANPAGLRGALFSKAETVVQPRDAVRALAQHARKRGVKMHFETPVVKVHEDAVETSDGRLCQFDRLFIAAGDEMRLLFPEELAAAKLLRCQLQMMRTAPQPAGFDLGAILVSDLTLCHYPAFAPCPSAPKLRARLEAELPKHKQWGVHVIAAQHPDGSLVLGDTHEYAPDFEPEIFAELEDLVLEALKGFARIPNSRITSRWHGVYLKSARGQTQVVLHPRERVSMATAMGGLGMTLSWGLAAHTIASWAARPAAAA